MLQWWRVPLHPDWINAENTMIWLVTFQIQISNLNFQIQNKLLFNLPVFAAKSIFKTYQHFCFLCFHSRWRFFWFHKDREITKKSFYLSRKFTGRHFGIRCINISKWQFDRMQDFSENHFRVSGASWVNINNNYYMFLIFCITDLLQLKIQHHDKQPNSQWMYNFI